MKEKSTLKAGLGYIIGNYLLKGISFISVPIFARLMSKADFGVYNTFVAYEAILFVVIGLAIHSSYKNAYFKNEENSCVVDNYSSYASATIFLIIMNAAILLALSFIFSDFICKSLQMQQWMVVLLIIYAMSSAIITCYNTDCSLRLEYKKFLFASGFNAVFNIVISIVLIVGLSSANSYVGRTIGTVFAAFCVAIYALQTFCKRGTPRFNKKELRWGLKYSLPIVPHGISQVILSSFDRIMINNMIGSAEAGIYSFAYTIYSIIQVTSTSIDTVWSPWFYKKRGAGDLDSIKRRSSQIIILVLLLCIAFLMISPEFILIFGGKEYTESVFCVMPLVGSAFFAFLYFFPAVIEYYHGKTTYIAAGTAIAAAINIALNYLFIKKYGYVAAAYTTLVTYFLYFLFHCLISFKVEGRMLYSVKTIVFSSVAIITSVIFGDFLVHSTVIRLCLFVIFAAIAVCFEEKNFCMMRKFIASLLRRKNNNT